MVTYIRDFLELKSLVLQFSFHKVILFMQFGLINILITFVLLLQI